MNGRNCVEISDQLYKDAEQAAQANNRTVAEQIDHWCRIGKLVEEEPGTPFKALKRFLAQVL